MTRHHDLVSIWSVRSVRRNLIFVAVAVFFFASVGCGRFQTDYGQSDGSSGRTSVNGFGTFRQLFDAQGAETGEVTRLHRRSAQNRVLVWTPRSASNISSKVSQWMRRWFTRGKRTLVYVVPDSGSEADYWNAAISLAPPDQRLEYRRRRARAETRAAQWRLNRVDSYTNGWFRIKTLDHRQPVVMDMEAWEEPLPASTDSGEADSAQSDSGETDSVSVEASIETEFIVVPYRRIESDDTAPTTNLGPTGPSSGSLLSPGLANVNDAETRIESVTTRLRPLVMNSSGKAVVVEITSRQWGESSVIVVAGGSLLTNFAMTRPWNRRLGKLIAREAIGRDRPGGDPAGEVVADGNAMTGEDDSPAMVGFICTASGSIPVSTSQASIPTASGLELLTTRPISMLTIHVLFLGFVVCMVLLPIFGRPRNLPTTGRTQFALHIDAVAALMQRVNDRKYAESRIRRYLTQVRGETSGPWIDESRVIDDTNDSTESSVSDASPPESSGRTDDATR